MPRWRGNSSPCSAWSARAVSSCFGEYAKLIKGTEGLQAAVEKLGAQGTEPLQASAVEFILEGLHLNKRLNKDKVAGRYQYRG